MNNMLFIVRWVFTLPTLLAEMLFKILWALVVGVVVLIMIVFYPVFKVPLRNLKLDYLYDYAFKWKGYFPITNMVYRAWGG